MAYVKRNYPRLQQAYIDTVGPKAIQEFGLNNPHHLIVYCDVTLLHNFCIRKKLQFF